MNKFTHYVGVNAQHALCGDKDVYCTNVMRDVNCDACKEAFAAQKHAPVCPACRRPL